MWSTCTGTVFFFGTLSTFFLRTLTFDCFYDFPPDVIQTRKLYSPLLSHRKWYIRKFAAESFAYLLRKVRTKDTATTVDSVLALHSFRPFQALQPSPSSLNASTGQVDDESIIAAAAREKPAEMAWGADEETPEEYRDGLSSLLFETIKVYFYFVGGEHDTQPR